MDEVNYNEIRKEAKNIMDNFMSALGDIDMPEDFVLKRDNCFREENIPNKKDEDFKQRFLSNAVKTSGDAVLANKGEWTK